MAKHSKGKHGKPKTGSAFPFGRKDAEPSGGREADEDSSTGGASKGARLGAHAAHAAGSSKRPAPADPMAQGEPAAADSAARAAGADDASDAAASASAPAAEQNATDAPGAMGEEQSVHDAGDASAAEGTEAADQAAGPQGAGEASAGPVEGGFKSSSDILEDKKAKRKKIAKRVGITSVSVIGAAAAIYFVGVAVFSTHFMPNTHIDNLDLSFKTPEEVQATFDNKVGDYAIKVKGNGLNIAFTSQEAGIEIDSVGMTRAVADAQDPWKWPVQVFRERNMTSAMTDALTASTLSDVVTAAVEGVNATAKDPVNAYVAYDPDLGAFDIVPEVQGTKLAFEEVLADILVGAMTLQDQVVILDDALIKPEILSDDRRLVGALTEANELIKADLTLMMGGTEACKVTANDIQNWVSVTPEFTAVLDDAAMTAWATDLASKFNTVGSARTFTRPDGKNITVSGGDYGWKVDKGALASKIAESIRGGVTGNIDIPVLQGGSGYSGVGGKDWGTRYMDVDISEQHARLYGDDGSIIWESAIVSGSPTADRATPYGVYDLNLKGRNVTLTGRDRAGNITYETPVAYWMPFIRNSIGCHDATWQSSFGGNRWRQGHGSHGCINLPLSKAESLYGLLKVGDVVVVHT